MPHSIESAFDHEHVQDVFQFLSEYEFRLGSLETLITIRLYHMIGRSEVYFRQSHFIHTPKQAGPYKTSKSWNDYEAAAINQVVGAMNDHFRDALNSGCAPEESWLIPNTQFS